jgi:hypothetical protein
MEEEEEGEKEERKILKRHETKLVVACYRYRYLELHIPSKDTSIIVTSWRLKPR